MPRPVKCRMIEHKPDIVMFKPRGIPASMLEQTTLTFEELEAVRLKDLEGLDQSQAAERMNVSRATFQRVLNSARLKISDALVNGKAISIQGGNYSLIGELMMCDACGQRWRSNSSGVCPSCSSRNIRQFVPGHGMCGRGHAGMREEY